MGGDGHDLNGVLTGSLQLRVEHSLWGQGTREALPQWSRQETRGLEQNGGRGGERGEGGSSRSDSLKWKQAGLAGRLDVA